MLSLASQKFNDVRACTAHHRMYILDAILGLLLVQACLNSSRLFMNVRTLTLAGAASLSNDVCSIHLGCA